MNAHDRLTTIENAGVALAFDGARLTFNSNEPLTQKHVDYIRKHAPALTTAVRLRRLYPGADLADLLDWYQDDFEQLASATDDAIRVIVDDYLAIRTTYRRGAW